MLDFLNKAVDSVITTQTGFSGFVDYIHSLCFSFKKRIIVVMLRSAVIIASRKQILHRISIHCRFS